MKSKNKLILISLAVLIIIIALIGSTYSKVKSLELISSRDELVYVEGKDPDFSNLEFLVEFENGSTKSLSGNQIKFSDINTAEPGEKIVTGAYRNEKIEITVLIREKKLIELEIVNPPDLVNYIQGQSIELDGIIVKGHYDNGTYEDLDGKLLVINDYDPDMIGSQEIKIGYNGHYDIFKVEFAKKTLQGIEIISLPTKLVYPENVNLDLSGLKVEAMFDNGIPEIINDKDFKVVGFEKNKIGDQNLTVAFEGHSAEFTIEVEKKKEVGISVASRPSKVVYELNDNIDYKGLKVVLDYDNGETEIIENDKLVISGFNSKIAGTQKVSVRYKDYKTDFDLRVKPLMVGNPNSIDVVVNKSRAVSEGFIPSDLVKVDIPVVYLSSEANKMKRVAADALYDLYIAAKESGFELIARSGYRSYNTQSTLYSNSVKNNGYEHASKYSAQPGHSEHQTGLAMDVTAKSVNNQLVTAFGSAPEGVWLSKNAHKFGFIIRYQLGSEDITGYAYEPWHIRYVGRDMASILYNKGITLEEYFGFN
ncbi:D-alanyl-D-alanine carboxypeptidase family protein [Alkalibacter mobilis]|uniref:D-alanyl-D-alanine carboxypeptidase family protein n=1 Tax=Alkalibacter mobilis TaxID=2787712 RepID=UPI0018A089BF|nr:D-alanyl-D-alanine carboxypeptidase family protein [Alkalibacter mobilis]MBF7097677.1 D-alanyl-D-alanine carboxypeptidase family protein [Alkalibacter mobilis]